MGKSRRKSVPYAREHAPLACAMTAGPALLAALRPVAERLRAQQAGGWDLDEVVVVHVTRAESVAILAAVDKGTWGDGA